MTAPSPSTSGPPRPMTPPAPSSKASRSSPHRPTLTPTSYPSDLVHGSTVATNAIIERKGARTALITTRGFRDVLAIGRQTRPKLYDLSPQREPPLVPDDLRLEANERLDHRGEVLQSLDPAEIETLLDYVQQSGVESLAVCFLFSFLEPGARAPRRRGGAQARHPDLRLATRCSPSTASTSARARPSPTPTSRRSWSDTSRGSRRARASTASSACALCRRTAAASVPPRPDGSPSAPRSPARPEASPALSRSPSAAGFDRIITLDMGGTSTDVALCPGRILERDETLVGGLPVRGPTVDVLSVGAGGGSIARLDEGGALRVGPESAGADPGPACYGRGDQPTVTDAHVVLGRIAPEQFLGGRMSIDAELSFDGDEAHRSAVRRRSTSRRGRRAARRQREYGARAAQSSPSSAATTRATSRSSPSAAPGRCTPATSPPPPHPARPHPAAPRRPLRPRHGDGARREGPLGGGDADG